MHKVGQGSRPSHRQRPARQAHTGNPSSTEGKINKIWQKLLTQTAAECSSYLSVTAGWGADDGHAASTALAQHNSAQHSTGQQQEQQMCKSCRLLCQLHKSTQRTHPCPWRWTWTLVEPASSRGLFPPPARPNLLWGSLNNDDIPSPSTHNAQHPCVAASGNSEQIL